MQNREHPASHYHRQIPDLEFKLLQHSNAFFGQDPRPNKILVAQALLRLQLPERRIILLPNYRMLRHNLRR